MLLHAKATKNVVKIFAVHHRIYLRILPKNSSENIKNFSIKEINEKKCSVNLLRDIFDGSARVQITSLFLKELKVSVHILGEVVY